MKAFSCHSVLNRFLRSETDRCYLKNTDIQLHSARLKADTNLVGKRLRIRCVWWWILMRQHAWHSAACREFDPHMEQLFAWSISSCSGAGCLCMWLFYVWKRTHDTGIIPRAKQRFEKKTQILVLKFYARHFDIPTAVLENGFFIWTPGALSNFPHKIWERSKIHQALTWCKLCVRASKAFFRVPYPKGKTGPYY